MAYLLVVEWVNCGWVARRRPERRWTERSRVGPDVGEMNSG